MLMVCVYKILKWNWNALDIAIGYGLWWFDLFHIFIYIPLVLLLCPHYE